MLRPIRHRGSIELNGSWNTGWTCWRNHPSCRPRSAVTSRSSNTTRPAVGSIRRRTHRASVLLPEPDSPTIASTSPGWISRSTSSTACTTASLPEEPPVGGEVLHETLDAQDRRPGLRRRDLVGERHLAHAAPPAEAWSCWPACFVASDEPARDQVVVRLVRERRHGRAFVHHVRAARREAAPRRRVREIRHPSADHAERSRLLLLGREGGQQRLRVRMTRGPEDLRDGRDLDQLPGVHHPDAVADLRDHAQVVRDQHDRRPEPPTQIAEQVEHLRLDGDVQGGRRFVRQHEGRLVRERGRDHDPLPHAAGQPVRRVVVPALGLRDPDVGEQLERPLPGSVLGDVAMRRDRLRDLRTDRERRDRARSSGPGRSC